MKTREKKIVFLVHGFSSMILKPMSHFGNFQTVFRKIRVCYVSAKYNNQLLLSFGSISSVDFTFTSTWLTSKKLQFRFFSRYPQALHKQTVCFGGTRAANNQIFGFTLVRERLDILVYKVWQAFVVSLV